MPIHIVRWVSVTVVAVALVACGSDTDSIRSDGAGGLGTLGGNGGTSAGGSDAGGTGGNGGTGSVSGGSGGTSSGGAGGVTPAPVQPCVPAPQAHASPLGTCDASGWCWESPLPNGVTTYEIWAATDSDAWAVQDGGSLHWDGVSWSLSTAPGGKGIWGSTANDIWIVGDDGIKHYDGASWSKTSVTVALERVHGSAANNVWATGTGAAVAWHWNGVTWSSVTNAPVGLALGVWTNAPDDVWAIFGLELFRFDGSTWTKESPGPIQPHSLWASGPNDVWIGGDAGAVRWNGSTYIDVPLPLGGEAVHGIAGRSASDVWLAAGDQAHHWNGTGIASSTFEGDFFRGGGFWLPATGQPWAFASEGYSERHFQRWDGSSWHAVGPVLGEWFHDVWGSAWNDIWAVGGQSIAHFDGSKWTPMSVAPPSQMRALWGASSNDVYAVGWSDLHRWDGTSWSILASDQAEFLDVWGTGPSDVWVLTTKDVRHWDGSSLTKLGGAAIGFTAIWASSAADVWVAGAGVARFNGTSWEVQTLPVSVSENVFTEIWGRGPNDIWVSGTHATLHFDGTTWSKLTEPDFRADSIWGCGNDTVVLLNSKELIVSNGGAFETIPLAGQLDTAVWGASADHLLVVGAGSAIKRRAQ